MSVDRFFVEMHDSGTYVCLFLDVCYGVYVLSVSKQCVLGVMMRGYGSECFHMNVTFHPHNNKD